MPGASPERDLMAGKCATCRGDLPDQGMGRPREYCCDACSEVARALRRLQRALPGVPRPQELRSLFVAEVLNRLPVDRGALAERARRQPRDRSGRFL